MRAMRRKFSTALGVFLAGACLAQSPAQEQKQLLTEYWTAMHHMFVAMIEARSSRSLAVRWNKQGQETRVFNEESCPGGHHMQVFRGGALVTDFYSVAGKEFRYEKGKWVESAAPKSSECRSYSEIQRDVAGANKSFDRMMGDLDDLAAHEAVTKGPVKTVHGIRCQVWTVQQLRPPENLPGLRSTATGPESVCISLTGWHDMERISPGPDPKHPAVTTYYDWNKPITISAPQ